MNDSFQGLTFMTTPPMLDTALALYERMAADMAAQVAALPDDMPIADRFHAVMAARLNDAIPYRDALGALFGAAANPNSGVSVLGESVGTARAVELESFQRLVRESADTPRGDRIEHLAILLSSLHFLTILFWLYDRSANQRATADLLDFVRDSLAMLRPMLVIPMVSSSLARLAGIAAAMFADQPDRDG